MRLDLTADPAERARIADTARQIAEQIRNSHLLLTGEAAPLPGYYRYSGALRALYFNQPLHLDQQVRIYLQAAQDLLDEPDPARRAVLRNALLSAAMGRLPEALRQAARLYRDEARTRAGTLRLLGLGVLALTLGLLLGEITLVFRPMPRNMAAARSNLKEMTRKMEDAATTDSLTSLHNRTKLSEVRDREVSAALGGKLRRLAKGFQFGSQPLTLSLGLASFRQGDGRESLLLRAAEALEQAKAKGRDRLETEAAPA